MRLMELYQVAFQCQRLQIGIAQQDVKVIHLRHHGGYLGGMLLGMEIAAHAVFQVDRLAHIDDLALMLHQVAAGAVGQHGQLGSQVFAQHRAPLPFNWDSRYYTILWPRCELFSVSLTNADRIRYNIHDS